MPETDLPGDWLYWIALYEQWGMALAISDLKKQGLLGEA